MRFLALTSQCWRSPSPPQCWAATGVQVSNRELEAQQAARRAAKAAAAAEKLDAAWRAAARKVGGCG